MGIFDDILARADEADRAVILKYPDLKTTFETTERLNEQNQAWLTKNYDFTEKKTFRELELEAAVVAANERAVAAAAGGNADMTFEQIEANLKANGYLKKAEVDAQIAQARTGVEQFIAQRDTGAMVFAAEAATLAIHHQKEFGQDLDANGFAKYVAGSNAQNPREAYNQYVAGMRNEKQTKELETLRTQSAAELERVKAEGLAEGRRLAQMEAAQNGGMPVDQGKGQGMGWLQQRQIDRTKQVDADGNQQVPGGKLGDGSATQAIMQQLAKDRAEGKVLGTVQ